MSEKTSYEQVKNDATGCLSNCGTIILAVVGLVAIIWLASVLTA